MDQIFESSRSYAFVMINIARNAFRHIISRNLSDMSRYTRAMGRFMDVDLIITKGLGRGVF